MKLFFSFLFLAITSIPLLLNADVPAEKCGHLYQFVGPKTYIRQYDPNTRSCNLNVNPSSDSSDGFERSFSFYDNGIIMVFNTYGDGDGRNSTSTAARVFYTFPRNRVPDLFVGPNDVLVNTATAGISFIFDKETGNINSITDSKFIEDPKVTRKNRGGLEINSLQTLWLDGGFAVGSDPTNRLGNSSTFHDSKGNTCKVTNSEIFKKIIIEIGSGETSEDFALKWSKDSDLSAFLKKRCPQLQVNF